VRFAQRALPAKDAADYIAQSMSAWKHRYEARVTLQIAAEEFRRRFPPHWGLVEPIDERSCEYRTGDDDLDWLALRIALFGVEFEIHEPPELVEHVRAMARRLDRAARPASESDLT
jgi:predicted DNA-binding transcriptional regulator YafY